MDECEVIIEKEIELVEEIVKLKKVCSIKFSPSYLQCNETMGKQYSVVVACKLFRGDVMPLLCFNKRII